LAKTKQIRSANFKRNTLTVAAVILFGLIVLSEIALAISIPWYLTGENAMAREVLQINLRDSFDRSRRIANESKIKDEIKQTEMRLVRWSLDSMADYLRQHTENLNTEELKHIQGVVTTLTQIANRIHSRRSYSEERRLDTGLYVNSLLNKEKANDKTK
jgi:hypothetical protein